MTMLSRNLYTVPVLLRGLIIALALSSVHPSWAAISLGQTRLIISAKDKESTLNVSNEGAQPVLLQMWIDLGDNSISPEKIAVPFVITPPIVRLDGKKTQRLRVMFTGSDADVPADKESAYWLNVLEIPPKPSGIVPVNEVQLAFITRIKIFYRPKKVNAMDISHVEEKLHFSLINQGGKMLRIENPTPINQTLISISIGHDIKKTIFSFHPEESMIPPYTTKDYPLLKIKGSVDKTMMVFTSTIGDYGEIINTENPLDD
ncbi:molecular chaperone [Serratia fonticola]|uniref:fimbrial biogenesis chaperone n=1 Tax=Serratia fonticola TaxID=47917 RepID=UPI00192C2AF4|nr:molecular chaperone [Serratia fonticola]MBL5862826.1 molecular chaperone [Serratia fonticola]